MKSNSNLKENFIYNIMYQILSLILPLITVPYVSRVLGAEGIGTYSYTYSIVTYFMLVGMLGINNYGNRTIAKCREDKDELSKNFFGIYSIQFFMTILMIIFYFLFVYFQKDYKVIFIIQSLYLISTLFDVNWFFFGIEKFKITVTRNMIIKILSLVLILILVKSKNDVWKYTLVMASSTLLTQSILIVFLKKYVKYEKITISDVKKHIKPCLILFIPVIAVSLYKIMDKTMIGLISNVKEVGYYEQAEKIINIPMGIITALGTVMLPRISNLVSKGDKDSVNIYIKKSMNFMMFLAFPICFGIIAISNDVIKIFLGQEFAKSGIILNYLSITLLFISFANIIRTQYLIPNERDKEYTISLILGAIINLVMNIIFIPKLASIGACFGTIAAEFVVMLYQIIAVRKEINIKENISNILGFFKKSIIMFIIIYFIKFIKIDTNIRIFIQIAVGVIVYVMLNLRYISSIINIPIINKLVKNTGEKCE